MHESSLFSFVNILCCRYRNIYCAICNGVEDVLYWRVDMGAVRVANDSCHHHIRSWLNSEKIKQLRWNPSVQILKNSW